MSCRPLNFEFQMKEPFIFESRPIFRPVSATGHEGKARILYGKRAVAEPGTRC